jgi:valyl-tRNA synthetase
LPAEYGSEQFPSVDAATANAHYGDLEGKTANQVRAAIVEKLQQSGQLIGEIRPITHPVKFYEKGERPLEIVTSRQWYVKTLEHREELLRRGEELVWHPEYMKHRYRSWVEGLNVDWNISRQRFFGVPFPVWYRLDEHGEPDHDHPILADVATLPIDPSSDTPAGYSDDQRGVPNGFIGDPDVMDTWATSSLSPQVAGHWGSDLFARIFPMDLRPQAHEIIRTWLFSTVVRSHFQENSLPFRNALISGWVLDPEKKKMSKSVGNVVTPMPLLEEHGADALRYWAASGRPGTDTAIDFAQMKIGRRLAIKTLNVTKFVLGRLGNETFNVARISEPLDVDLANRLRVLVEECTTAFEGYDYARALEKTENFFWSFCDDFVELVKIRAYGESDATPTAATMSARATLSLTLSVLQRLLAPFQPFTTEEAWSWWHEGSVHTAPWPSAAEFEGLAPSTSSPYEAVSHVLESIRRAKSEAKASQRVPVAELTVEGSADFIAAVQAGEADLRDAGSVASIVYLEATEQRVAVVLGEVTAS